MRASRRLAAGAALLLATLLGACGGADRERSTVGLIIEQDTNPFFVKIRDTVKDAAGDDNVRLLSGAGKSDVDNATGVELITAEAVDGVDSRDEAFGVRNCWGDECTRPQFLHVSGGVRTRLAGRPRGQATPANRRRGQPRPATGRKPGRTSGHAYERE